MMPQAPGDAGSKASHSSRRLENLRVTSEKAKESREKAHQVFLCLIEGAITPQVFSDKVRWINPEAYEDIVKERALTGLCGYPVCGQTFSDTFGPRTYIIRNNKVYDINDRRNYCSGVCFEASELVLRQVSTEPLYLRHTQADDLPLVKLPSLQQLKGRYGKIINITGGLLDIEEDKLKQKSVPVFKTVDDIARDSLISLSENADTHNTRGKGKKKTKEKLDVIEEDEAGGEGEMEEDCEAGGEDKSEAGGEGRCGEVNKDRRASGEMEVDEQRKQGGIKRGPRKMRTRTKERESSESSLDEIKEEEEKERKHEEADSLVLVFEVEKSLREWMSFDSLRFILGDKYVRGMLEHIGSTWEDYDTTAGLKLGMEAKSKYIALCRKLDHEERRDEVESRDMECGDDGGDDSGGGGGEAQPRRPLPNYQQLQNDAKKEKMKVVSFLGGQDQYEEIVREGEGNLETIPEENITKQNSTTTSASSQAKIRKHTSKFKKGATKGTTENAADDDDENWTMPYVDSYCQAAWRQHIVLEKLTSYMSDGVGVMRLEGGEVRRLLRSLVATLDLTPHNITFKPTQWRLVTYILIHMLTVRYPVIHKALRSKEGLMILTEVTSGLRLDMQYFDRVMTYLTEIKYIISKNFRKQEEEAAGGNNKEGKEGRSSERQEEEATDKNFKEGEESITTGKKVDVQESKTAGESSAASQETAIDSSRQGQVEAGVVKMDVESCVDGQALETLTLD